MPCTFLKYPILYLFSYFLILIVLLLTAHFDIPTILYGPGSLEEAHSVDEKIEAQELQTYSDVLYTFLKHWYEHPEK